MLGAQVLCTTTLSYRPCGMVAATDATNCFLICHAQILAGATSLMERAARECAARAAEPADAGSPSCEFAIERDSPVDPHELQAACNTRCRELQADGGVVATAP
jgi:hypothetical protein